MNEKRAAREFCFQYFFHLQLPVFEALKQEYSSLTDEALINSINEFKSSTNTLLGDDSNKFVLNNIKGTLQHYEEIEEIIKNNINNWKISRLSKVDHTNLLLAVHELCFSKVAPPKVVINEAIELSKKFGSKESSAFINGVLDNISKNN